MYTSQLEVGWQQEGTAPVNAASLRIFQVD